MPSTDRSNCKNKGGVSKAVAESGNSESVVNAARNRRLDHGTGKQHAKVKAPVRHAGSSKEHEEETAQKLGEGCILIKLLDVLFQVGKREVLQNGGHDDTKEGLTCFFIVTASFKLSECMRTARRFNVAAIREAAGVERSLRLRTSS